MTYINLKTYNKRSFLFYFRKEMNAVRGTSYIHATLFAFGMVSRLSIFLSLISYIYFGNILTARKVFIVSSFFNILNLSMVFFWPLAITSVAEGFISIKRVQEFLLSSENKPNFNDGGEKSNDINKKDEMKLKEFRRKNLINEVDTISKNVSNGGALKNGDVNIEADKLLKTKNSQNSQIKETGVSLENATALWEIRDGAVGMGIKNINLKIGENQLCAVVGQVGSGKTTLLQVILRELDIDSGHISINGVVSYASQEAWLFEGTIRNNIVFIDEYDEKRYKEVVRVCCLERDFKLLPYGDSTVVGERGISLSGGQKARVNLARAIYKQADIYLLDDPLSAVDTHVGKHIFDNCIKKYLSNKICILVTHQLQYLKKVKHLVIMNGGKIEAQGSYDHLKNNQIDSLLSIQSPDEAGNDPEEVTKKREVGKNLNVLYL